MGERIAFVQQRPGPAHRPPVRNEKSPRLFQVSQGTYAIGALRTAPGDRRG